MSKAAFKGVSRITFTGIQWWASPSTRRRLPKEMSVRVDLFSTDDEEAVRKRALSKVEATTGFRIKDCRRG